MTYVPSGHIEQLPSGSWRAKVYAGKDPLTGREIRFRKTRKTEVEAQIELGRLLELARCRTEPRLRRHRRRAARRVRPRRRVGRLHGGSQPRLHPPHHQARARDQGSTQGSRPAAGQPLRAPAEVRRPGVHRQAIHRAPPRPRPATRPGQPQDELAADSRETPRSYHLRCARPRRRPPLSIRTRPAPGAEDQALSSTRSSSSQKKGCWSSATAALPRSQGTRPRTVTPPRGTGPPGRGQATTARCPAASRMPATR